MPDGNCSATGSERKKKMGRPFKPRVVPVEKACLACKEVKPISDFYIVKRAADGHRGKCKDCWNANRYRWIEENREHVLEQKRGDYQKHRERYLEYSRSDKRRARWFRWKLERQFGITVEQYETMFEAQSGLCAICGEPASVAKGHGHKHRLHVDHDHKSNKVRGLLCNLCNVGLGCFKDSQDLLEKSISYLQSRSQ